MIRKFTDEGQSISRGASRMEPQGTEQSSEVPTHRFTAKRLGDRNGAMGWCWMIWCFCIFCMLLCCYICLIMSLSLILNPQHQILNIEKERGREGFSRQDIATHAYFPWFNHQTFTQRACQQDFVDGNSSTEGTASRDWPRDAGEQAF